MRVNLAIVDTEENGTIYTRNDINFKGFSSVVKAFEAGEYKSPEYQIFLSDPSLNIDRKLERELIEKAFSLNNVKGLYYSLKKAKSNRDIDKLSRL